MRVQISFPGTGWKCIWVHHRASQAHRSSLVNKFKWHTDKCRNNELRLVTWVWVQRLLPGIARIIQVNSIPLYQTKIIWFFGINYYSLEPNFIICSAWMVIFETEQLRQNMDIENFECIPFITTAVNYGIPARNNVRYIVCTTHGSRIEQLQVISTWCQCWTFGACNK